MSRFVGTDLGRERAPPATTLLRFRHLAQEHGLNETLFGELNRRLGERGLLMRAGASGLDAPFCDVDAPPAKTVGLISAAAGHAAGTASASAAPSRLHRNVKSCEATICRFARQARRTT